MLTPDNIFVFTVLGFIAFAIVHLVFAIGVFVDSSRLVEETGADTAIVPGPMWAFTTLLGGVFVATAYWIIHRSTLSRHDKY